MNDNPFELVSAQQDPDRHNPQSARQRLVTHLPPRVLLDFRESAKYTLRRHNL